MKFFQNLNSRSSDLDIPIILIISLFPVILVSGPFLSDLFCIILGIAFLYTLYQDNAWHELHENYYFKYFILIFCYLNLNSFFSFNPEISFSKSLPFIRIILFVFSLSFFLNRYKNLYKNFFYCFFLILLLMILDSLLQLLFNHNIFGISIIFENRISSFFGDEKIMGSYITRLLPIIVSIPFIINYKKKFLINFFIITLSSVLVFLSAERLAIFYLLSFLIFYFLITKKFFLKFISLTFVFIFLINLYNPIFAGRIINSTIQQINQTETVTSYRHLLHYITAYEMFKDEKILGNGLKSFRYLCSEPRYQDVIEKKQIEDIKKKGEKDYLVEFENGCNTHPHNIYLEFMAELGLIGMILFSVIMFFCSIKIFLFLKHYFLNNKINDLIIAKNLILFGIFIQMFPLTPSGSFFNNYMMIIFHLSIGFYLSVLKIKR
jgi:O-antigen ligase